jgi:hypothetical protein
MPRIGGFEVDLYQINGMPLHQSMSQWYTLIDSKKEASGTLLLDIAIVAHTSSSPSTSSISTPSNSNNNYMSGNHSQPTSQSGDEEVDYSIVDAAKIDPDSLLMYQVCIIMIISDPIFEVFHWLMGNCCHE